jgi:hypothetical protein
LIIGRALKLPPEDVAFLISADLFAAESPRWCNVSVSPASVSGCQ